MRRVLVTVAYGRLRRDLAVRGDVPIGDLLGPLAEALGAARARPGGGPGASADRGPGEDPGDDPGEGLGLAPLCGPPLPLERSLSACGVGHGAVLVLMSPPATASHHGAWQRPTPRVP
jgi:hypothetical protein